MDTDAAFAELELDPGADAAAIKAAWRRLVSRWHPDRYPGSDGTQRIQRINSAYGLLQGLQDDAHRLGRESGGFSGSSNTGPHGRSNETREAHQAEAGHQADRQADSRATPIRRKLRVRWSDVALGLTTTVKGQVSQACKACTGSGWQLQGGSCAKCEGTGQTRRPSLFPWLGALLRPCEDCDGRGLVRSACRSCDGCGRQRRTYRQTVRLPAGIGDGQVWQAPVELDPGTQATLHLTIAIEPDARLRLDDQGVMHASVDVNGWAWVAERWTEVPTPTGVQQMRLRRDHRRYRLAGQGVPPTPGAPRGDLIVHVQPVFPDTLDAQSEALLDQLVARTSLPPADAHATASRAQAGGKPTRRHTRRRAAAQA
jgi:molecular chaperone DnaJ